jgi:hypothetical protein
MDYDTLLAEARKLPEGLRDLFAHELQCSLPKGFYAEGLGPNDRPDLPQSVLDELDRRLADLEQNRHDLIPWEQAKDELLGQAAAAPEPKGRA